MLKKGLVISGAIALLLLLLFGGSVCSYVGTAVTKVQERVQDATPLEFQLDRAKHEIERLGPVIRHQSHEIAKEEVAVERLERQINDEVAQLGSEKDEIMTLTAALNSGKSVHRFVSTGRSYTSEEVEQDLSRRFERYKSRDEMAKAMEKRLEARKAQLDAAREQLENTISAKQELEVEVANLEAQKKMIDVAKSAKQFNFDNSQLAKTRKLIDDIQARIEVESKLVNAEETFDPGIELKEPVSTNIREEVTNYFQPTDVELVGSSAN